MSRMTRILWPLILLFAISLSKVKAADVVINEIMQSNVDGLMVKKDFPDSWIELYNNRSRSLNLKGWRIGLTRDFDASWQFAHSQTIFGHDYLMVYCDKVDNGYTHTDFHLDAKKCTIYLWDAEGNLIDSVAHKKQPAPNVGYGRTVDGGEEWGYEASPTPGAANAGVFTSRLLPDPVFSMAGCVLTEASGCVQELTIAFPDLESEGSDFEPLPADTRLYVTTDCSAPTTASPSYGPDEVCHLALTQTTVVRARLLSAEALSALPVTHSYIFHPRTLALPVFSLATNGEYLYDEEIGMLLGTDYHGNCYKGWRRPFNLEYFEPSAFDSARINQVCEAGMHGAGSLSHKQKAMNIYTNKRWQKKRFDSSTFWPERPELTETKTFCLRNGGSRCLDSRMEDAFVQKLFAQHVDSLQYLEYRACVVYINGEYRGLYGLRERANHTWAENNRGVAEDVAIEVESCYDEGEAYAPIKSLIDSHSKDYAQYCRFLDMPLMLDYLCCQAFATNMLFPHSNMFMWTDPTGEDRRIHPLLKDLDALAETASSTNWFNYLTLTGSEGTWAGAFEQRYLFVRLFEMQEFLNAFLDRMQVYLGDFCKPSVTLPLVERMRAEIDAEVAATFAAIDEGATYADFDNRITQLLIPYCQKRPMIHYQHLSDRFGLGRVIPLTVVNHVATADAPVVRINGISLTEGDFEGACFANRDIRLETGSLDYVWSRIITYTDGTTDYRIIPEQITTFRPKADEAKRIMHVEYALYYQPVDSHEVVLTFTDGGVICSNPYASNGVEVVIEGNEVSITSQSRDEVIYRLTGKANEAHCSLWSANPWHMVLDGVSLQHGAGTIIQSTGLAMGRISLTGENVLTNKALESDREHPGAAIYAQGTLTIDGDGSLEVNTSGKVGSAIATEHDLTILSGNYTLVNRSKGLKDYGVIWPGKTIYSHGSMSIVNGQISIETTGMGCEGVVSDGSLTLGCKDQSNNDQDGPTLDIHIKSTTMYTPADGGSITQGCHAIVAQGCVDVYGQTLIYASAIDNASNGIKSPTGINIHGGVHQFECYDDCLNSQGPITISGGTTVCFSTDDDAIDSDYPYPGAIRLTGGNLLTYTLDVATEEGLDCDDYERIFISGGIVVAAGGAHYPDSRRVGGSTQGYYLGPGIRDCDSLYYYSLVGTDGNVVCTYRFRQSFANVLSLMTAPTLGNGTFHVVYGIEPPTGYTQAVGDSFWIGGTTANQERVALTTANLYPTTMAVMGASISVMPESSVCKDYWASAIGLDIRDYGIKGAGLSSLTQPGYGLQEEVDDVAFLGRPDYDAYLIWAPSNDYQKQVQIGSVTDYSQADGYNASHLTTMCGGLNYCLRRIREKDPDACILLFTTMPIFTNGAEGYDVNARGSQSMRAYVDAQIDWCERNGIPYLDLFRDSGITRNNYSQYMLKDAIHLNESGYDLIRPITTDFLRMHIQTKDTSIEDILCDLPSASGAAVYTLGGQRISAPGPGLHIVRHGDGRVEKRLITR